MSILIKDADMPTQCYDCYLVARDPDGNGLYCKHLKEDIADLCRRLPNCPLVEVKTPHGRLIDADAFAKTIKDISIRQRYDKLTFDKSLTVDDVLDSVIVELNASGLDGSKNAPTVIDAEG